MNDLPLDRPRYTRIVAAQLAEISLDFLERCEMEELVRVRIIRDNTPAYSAQDIRKLAMMRRLHEDLELDFPALEVVLNMRSQVLDLREQLEKLEQELAEREERLVRELTELRRRASAEQGWR